MTEIKRGVGRGILRYAQSSTSSKVHVFSRVIRQTNLPTSYYETDVPGV